MRATYRIVRVRYPKKTCVGILDFKYQIDLQIWAVDRRPDPMVAAAIIRTSHSQSTEANVDNVAHGVWIFAKWMRPMILWERLTAHNPREKASPADGWEQKYTPLGVGTAEPTSATASAMIERNGPLRLVNMYQKERRSYYVLPILCQWQMTLREWSKQEQNYNLCPSL